MRRIARVWRAGVERSTALSERLKELASRQEWLQERCAAQRDAIALEAARIEARFSSVDRVAGIARGALLNPIVLFGSLAVLLAVGRSRAIRIIGRVVLLSGAARRLIQLFRRL